MVIRPTIMLVMGLLWLVLHLFTGEPHHMVIANLWWVGALIIASRSVRED